MRCVGRVGVVGIGSRLAAGKRRLLEAAAVGALMLPGGSRNWGQVAATLPEVTVSRRGRRRPPRPARARPRCERRHSGAGAGGRADTGTHALSALQVIATTPVTGIGFDRNKVPAMVQTLTAEDFSRVYSPNVVDTLQQRIPGVVTTDVQGNGFFQDLRYRGFAASPLQGTPQGLAVYMQGIRVNEAFGDTVNWDLIPTVAIGRADIWTNNPAFGLNALGGAVSLQMKDGFTYNGFEFDTSGGSYGRVGGSLQYGVRNGEWGLYLAARRIQGRRLALPVAVAARALLRRSRLEGHRRRDPLSSARPPTTISAWSGRRRSSSLNNDYRSIFTWPQTTKNQAQLLALNGRYSVTDHWTVQSNLYYRKFHQAHVDGNAAEVERCSGAAGNPLFNTLCLEDDGFPPQPKANFQILNPNNQPINCPPGTGNTCARVPWGTVDRTLTNAMTTGASLQALNDDKVFGHDNYFTIGGSVDRSKIGFQGNSELGYIYPDFFVGPNAAVPGTGQIVHTAGNIGFSPGQPRRLEYLLRRLHQRHLRHHQPAVGDCGRTLQHRPDRHVRSARHQSRPQRPIHVRAVQSGGGLHLQDPAGADDVLCRVFGSQPRADAARARLLQSAAALPAGRLPGLRSAAATRWSRARARSGCAATSTPPAAGATGSSGCSAPTAKATSSRSRAFCRAAACSRTFPPRAGRGWRRAPSTRPRNISSMPITPSWMRPTSSPACWRRRTIPSADANGDILVTPGKQIPGIPRHQIKGGVDYLVTPR